MRPRPGIESAVTAMTATMVLALLPGVPGAVRAVVAVTFFLLVPGLAWIRALPVTGTIERAGAVVAVSLAVDVVLAQALLHLGVPGAVPVLVGLLAVSGAGLAVTREREGVPA